MHIESNDYFRKQLYFLQLPCSNWCSLPIGTWFHVSSQGNSYFQKNTIYIAPFSPQFTSDLMKLITSTSPEKLPKIEVLNSKSKPKQEPSMFSEPLTVTNTTDFSISPRVTASKFATLVSLIMTTPINHPRYLTMIKMTNLTLTQLLSVKMQWPTPKIQMRAPLTKISTQMTLIPKLKLVVMKSSILTPPTDLLTLRIVG